MPDNRQKIHLEVDDLILKISSSMGREYFYYMVQNMEQAELLVQLRSFQDLYGQKGETKLEEFLKSQGAMLILCSDSNGFIAENPINFYDVEYDYDTGITDLTEFSVIGQAEMLIDKIEYGRTVFTREDRNLIVNHAYQLENMENTKLLIRKLTAALDGPDSQAAYAIRREAQEEIERGRETFQNDRDEQTEIQRVEQEMREHPEIHSLQEAMLRLGNEERYGIYQIRDDTPGREYAFMDLDFIQSHGHMVHQRDYELVYTDRLDPAESLNLLYERFNINRPADFTGHSLSVSDVIVTNRGGKVKAYFVDSIGFRELPEFYKELEESFIDHYYVVEDLEKPGLLAIREFEQLDEAMEQYFSLPNHQMKALGIQNTNPLPGSLDFIQCRNGIDTLIEDYTKVENWDIPEINQFAKTLERTLENHDAEIAYETEERYLYIQISDEGYDYTLYDKEYDEIDGGVYDDWDKPIKEVIEDILSENDISSEKYHVIDCEKFLEELEGREFPLSKEQEIKLYDGVAFKMGYGYFTVQRVTDGYDYIVYDSDYKEIAGGNWEEPDTSIYQAAKHIFKKEMGIDAKLEPVDYRAFVNTTIQKSMERLSEDRITPTSQIGRCEVSLHGKRRTEIEETVLCYAQSILDARGISDEVRLLGARVYGSRSREGLYHPDSDLDVVLSYTGNMREDTFFNALHEDGMKIAGLQLDVNPISVERTGTLEEYMKQAEVYLDVKEAHILATDIDRFAYDLDAYGYGDAVDDPEQNVTRIASALMNGNAQYLKDWLQEIVDEIDHLESVECAKNLINRMEVFENEMADAKLSKEKEVLLPDAKISFYVAECSEFHILGEFHENLTLEEAAAIFQQIPGDRMSGIKSIGFCLEDGSLYDGCSYDLYRGKTVMRDDINEIPHFRESPLVQKAISDMEKIAETIFHVEVKAAESKKEKSPVPDPVKSVEKKMEASQVSIKESVLMALRERQAKIKEQEKAASKQKEPTKNGPEL